MSQPFAPAETHVFRTLWDQQEGRCALCGVTMPATRFDVAHATLWKKWRPTVDHIVPVAAHGPDDLHNFQLAHALCNKRKGRRQTS